MCLREELNTAVEYLGHIRVQSKKQISLLMAEELKAKCYNIIPGHFLCRQCVKNIISWRVIRMNQMLSRMNQIVTTLVKEAQYQP